MRTINLKKIHIITWRPRRPQYIRCPTTITLNWRQPVFVFNHSFLIALYTTPQSAPLFCSSYILNSWNLNLPFSQILPSFTGRDIISDITIMAELDSRGGEQAAAEDERLLGGEVAVLDFDMLCSTVAMQAQNGKWGELNGDYEDVDLVSNYHDYGGGVHRMWEGELVHDCFEDRRLALQSSWYLLLLISLHFFKLRKMIYFLRVLGFAFYS